MAKRQRSVSLTFILLRFAVVTLGLMGLCGVVWLFALTRLRVSGIIYHGSVSNQQVEQMLEENPRTFVSPGEEFLGQYALFDFRGNVMESNVSGRELERLTRYFQGQDQGTDMVEYSYENGSTVVLRWIYRAEFVNPALRHMLPPFEYLWWATLCLACIFCLILHTMWLRRFLTHRLMLFGKVSKKIGARELDFVVPHAGIREYDQALDAMEHMRRTLYQSLSQQWEARQEREGQIAALAHDLKTPLTLVQGNAQLLLEEELPADSRTMVETIEAAGRRAGAYVTALLETSIGQEEPFEAANLTEWFEGLCRDGAETAGTKGICLEFHNGLEGFAMLQKERLLRALFNVVLNAIQYAPEGSCVHLEGRMVGDHGIKDENRESHLNDLWTGNSQKAGVRGKDGEGSGWQIIVRDEGPGFSQAALRHGTERLWREDTARSGSDHSGLGLWFAAQVVRAHGGRVELGNWEEGGEVVVIF